MKDNRIIVDITKVQYARFGYRNQDGDWRDSKPVAPTVHNNIFEISEYVFGTPTTLLEYAKQNKLLDVWTPELKLKVTANLILVYTGEKAVTLYKAWCERIFKKAK